MVRREVSSAGRGEDLSSPTAPAEVARLPQPGVESAATKKLHRIEPTSGWAALNLRELWEFRDLLVILATRDVKLRYKQTALGVTWVVLQPLLASVIFAVIFGQIAGLPSEGAPYLLFVYAALVPWNLFAGALQRAGNSLLSDSRLISKVYFPRLAIPIASCAAVAVDFAVGLAVMFVLMAIYGVAPSWPALALPVLLVLALLVSLGISLWFSALNVYYRDFTYALPFAIQVWMYASPLVYPASMIPAEWRAVYALNPMVGVIDGFRWALLGTGSFPWLSAGLSALVGGVIFVGGAFVFRRVERGFADAI